jgi:hypothetical protein
MTYDVGNPFPDWGQAHKCGGVEPVDGIGNMVLTLFFFFKQAVLIMLE